MKRSAVIEKLRAARDSLERQGVTHVALFGSVARDQASDASDVDVLVRFARKADLSLLDVVHLENELSDLLGRPVQILRDPVERKALRARIEADRFDVF
jgi:predicted nucleotidyltransferase